MIWIAVIILALVGFALIALLFKIERALWTSLLATLALGLAGYALQASPNAPSAPKVETLDEEPLFDSVAIRKDMMADGEASNADMMITSDAFARRQHYDEAAGLAVGVTNANPNDFEAWLALANALVDHTDGVLTPAALYAYRQAGELRPNHPAPGYFLGVSLIRQGRMMEARQVWSEALSNAPEGHVGNVILEGQLARLEAMLTSAAGAAGAAQGEQASPSPQAQTAQPAASTP